MFARPVFSLLWLCADCGGRPGVHVRVCRPTIVPLMHFVAFPPRDVAAVAACVACACVVWACGLVGDLREAVEKVEARDRRINDLNRQILQLNEALREQVRWGRQPTLSCVQLCRRSTDHDSRAVDPGGVACI